MYLLTVIPISRSLGKSRLSYFTTLDLPVGSLVEVPIRTTLKPALVVDKISVEKVKGQIKKADHRLRSISKLIAPRAFNSFIIKALEEQARKYVAPAGPMLEGLIPGVVLRAGEDLFSSLPKEIETKNTVFESFVWQSSFSDRVDQYNLIIRENFAIDRSTFILCPTIQAVKDLTHFLSSGIEPYCYSLHSQQSKKQVLTRWRDSLREEHPVVIIATKNFLTIPRPDIGSIIMEEEGSPYYQTSTRPQFHLRPLVEGWARLAGIKLVLADQILAIETFYRYENDQLIELAPLSFRLPTRKPLQIIDMKEHNTDPQEENNLISPELRKAFLSMGAKDRGILFANQRSLAPVLICRDCGLTINCPHCRHPLHLRTTNKIKKERHLICPLCGFSDLPSDICVNCQGHRLMALGIGTERLETLLSPLLPHHNLFRLDSGVAKTPLQADKIFEKFMNTDRSILIGTEMMLSRLRSETLVSFVAIASLDSLLAIPEYLIIERVFRTIIDLRSVPADQYLLQTRATDHPVLELVQTSDLRSFYRQELTLRRQFNYPPFSILIKINIIDKPAVTDQYIDKLKEKLIDYQPIIYPAGNKYFKGKKKYEFTH